LFVVSSCGEEEIIGNENPTLEEFYDPLQNYGLQFDMETEYDNFIAYTEYEEYSPDTERIACAIYNNNPGKGFYIYKSVFVEKNIDGEWVRYFCDEWYYEKGVWSVCGTENAPDECFCVTRYLRLSRVSPALDEGTYRIVVFLPTADKNVQEIYAEFKIVE
jgi:hypothetical protein